MGLKTSEDSSAQNNQAVRPGILWETLQNGMLWPLIIQQAARQPHMLLRDVHSHMWFTSQDIHPFGYIPMLTHTSLI